MGGINLDFSTSSQDLEIQTTQGGCCQPQVVLYPPLVLEVTETQVPPTHDPESFLTRHFSLASRSYKDRLSSRVPLI